MKVKNRLREILLQYGISAMKPTQELLEKLGGMTMHRFIQIMNNDSRKEMSVLEVELLKDWLSMMTGQQKAAIQLLQEEVEEVAA
ncbi:hypothetical protein HER32_06805 [Hymenobacter sp. BT18]|uniref:hypothetical protein n=1 Tax=Hymenobacter sp. BT18 TaxID=2835648 RepID=UPI00143E253B|nr:hypothetical protein [Hymenobacter sp. BT18]QIX60903.1 hypothetical protein HER32_06805 [Hymenobacter sp. BT18]